MKKNIRRQTECRRDRVNPIIQKSTMRDRVNQIIHKSTLRDRVNLFSQKVNLSQSQPLVVKIKNPRSTNNCISEKSTLVISQQKVNARSKVNP